MFRVAVIGTGDLFARTIRPRLEPSGPFHVVAHYGSGESPGDPCGCAEEAIERHDVDLVWLLGPARTHADQAIRALRAGKHVYVQKPLGTTADEVAAVVDAANHASAKIVAAPAQAAYPTIRRLKAELLDLEAVFFVSLPMMGWGGREISWPRDPSWRFMTGAGPLRDHGVYGLTTLLELFGPVRQVMAMGEVRVSERTWHDRPFGVQEWDNVAAVLQLAAGGYATLHEAWAAGAPEAGLRIHGLDYTITAFGDVFDACPRGFVRRGTWGDEVHRVDAENDAQIAEFFRDGLPNPHVWADIRHLAECIQRDVVPQSTPARALPVYRVIEAIERSARCGAVVEVTA